MCNSQVKDIFYGENAKFGSVKAGYIHSNRCAGKFYGHMTSMRVFIPTWEVALWDKIKLHNEKIYTL